jgi:MOSC domain-containing protein
MDPHRMTRTEGPHIAAIYRYPIKGLSPEPLSSTRVRPGETLPFDRAFAIENGPGRFDATIPRHLPKINFLMLMRDERLATLTTTFDETDQSLTISRDGKQVARGVLTDRVGRQIIEQFIAAYMKDSLRGPPRIVSASGHSFSDVAAKCVHIVNLNTVRDLARALDRDIDPLRFRANIYVEGLEPWSEFDWLDRQIRLGDVTAEVFARTQRCDATNVDPATGKRDAAVPADLRRIKGHADFGVYAKILDQGELKVGQQVTG